MSVVISERDFDLIEVALETAAEACQSGATLRGERTTDPLAREYLHALRAVKELRKREKVRAEPA